MRGDDLLRTLMIDMNWNSDVAEMVMRLWWMIMMRYPSNDMIIFVYCISDLWLRC